MKTAEEILKATIVNVENGVTIEEYDAVKIEEKALLIKAMEDYADQFKVKNLAQPDVSGSLPISEVIKGEEGKYYCGLLDGNDLISTQGKTIDEVFENMADAYRTIKAHGNDR